MTVLWKRPDVSEGLSDLPWHRDCGMGGHALNCPTAIMTICLTDGSPEAGHHLGGRHYNDVLLGDDGGQVEHLADRLAD